MDSELGRYLSHALGLDLPITDRLRPTPLNQKALPASVLVLLAGPANNPSVLLTLRTETVETHKGQIAFPGGTRDPEDFSDAETALRETEEEVGIPRALVRIVGALPPLPTLTGFVITPIVAVTERPPAEIPLALSPHEIADAFWISFSILKAPETYRLEHFQAGPMSFPIHVYQVGAHRIWGATAAVLKNLLDRWERLRLNSPT